MSGGGTLIMLKFKKTKCTTEVVQQSGHSALMSSTFSGEFLNL